MALPLHIEPDDEPLVVLDSAAEVESLVKSEREPSTDALTRVLARSVAAFGSATVAHDYLRSVGLPDAMLWSEFRLGIGDRSLADGLTTSDRSALADLGLIHGLHQTLTIAKPGGILLPTVDPREPERVLGVIRMTPSQYHLHQFMSHPAGIACGPDIDSAERIVLAATPLLGLRLAHLGATGVVIVEDAAVLPPLVEWLSDREIIIAGFRTATRAAMRAVLGPIGARATEVTVLPELERTTAATLAMLGVGSLDAPPAPITVHLLRDLHRYAVLRLQRGDGVAALRSLDIEHAKFIEHYQIGYLPATFRTVLSAEQRRSVKGIVPGNALVVPAFDEQKVVVDLLFLPVATCAEPISTVHDAPRGLIASVVTTAYDEIIVVDTVRAAADLTAQGLPHVIVLRGVDDARSNAARIAANGVRRAEVRCQRHGDEIAAILHAAGIEITITARPEPAKPLAVEPSQKVLTFPQAAVVVGETDVPVGEPEPVPAAVPTPFASPETVVAAVSTLVLLHHDQRTNEATFRGDDIAYIVEVPWDERTNLSVKIKRGILEYPDTLDLAEPAARGRSAGNAALGLGAPRAVIEGHLAQLHEAVRELVRKAAAPSPARRAAHASTMTDAERAEAMVLARYPDLLDHIVADLGALSWVGEESAKRFTFLAALSRNLDEPIWVAFTANGTSERSPGLDAIAAITPPEDCIHVSRLTDNAFTYADSTALRHKLLIIDDASSISSSVAGKLKVLKGRGALTSTRVERDPIRGDIRTRFIKVPGPVAVVTATSGSLDEQLRSHLMDVGADESPEHIAMVLAERRRRMARPAGVVDQNREQVVARLQNLQRVLAPRPVVIPFAERVSGFGSSPRALREHDTMMALIAVHALLHQHQRLSESGSIIATMADFAVAASLMTERMAMAETCLGRHPQRLLTAMSSAGLTSATMEDLARLLPDWTRYAFRSALDQLVALDFLSCSRTGQGKVRTYYFHARGGGVGGQSGSQAIVPRIHLRQLGDLAELGETTFAKFIPDSNTG